MDSSQPKLSHCFFQYFSEDKVPNGYQPILQVMETRPLQGQAQFKARLSDGIFTYAGCVVTNIILSRFQSDQLSTNNGIIQVTKWKRAFTKERIVFNILDYNLITLEFPVIGNPQPHSGNPEEYRNYMQIQNQCAFLQHTPTKTEPENAWGTSSAKRGRNSSPERQPLTKRQPNAASMPGIVPIGYITPYCNKWRICGIVSCKDPQIKEVTSAKGKFRVFSFVVTDQSSTSIRISAFSETADKYFQMIENGQAYYISGGSRAGSVRAANKQYNSTGHDYEIVLDRDSEIVYCNDKFDPPKVRLRPVYFDKISQHINECVDVQGVIERVNDLVQVTSRKDQQLLNKREVFLVDKSGPGGSEIALTLWNDMALNFEYLPGKVIGIKSVVVREFNGGFSLSNTGSTIIIEDPEGDYTRQLYKWYSDQKPLQEIKSLTTKSDFATSFKNSERDLRFIGPLLQYGIDRDNDKGQYLFIKGMVNAVKAEQAIYQACPVKGCRKKLQMEGNQYRCEKCNQIFDNYLNIIMLQIEVADCTGTIWLTMFDELATSLLETSADQLAQLQRDDHNRFDAIFNKLRFHDFMFRIRARYEIYNLRPRESQI
ncbi:Replication protein A subunit [Meloidogyne graminicola]|uniref:Replication protein A subunit n=1 Tax=Meloidogyne graminicola TaxID=189291 RepID=A0A8S9ZZ58_9BILA|nr:Replication protein A subunit [Meloidogyne graminicola]